MAALLRVHLVTVTVGYTPLSAIAAARRRWRRPLAPAGALAPAARRRRRRRGAVPPPAALAVLALPTLCPFLPWWTTVLLRLVQRRPCSPRRRPLGGGRRRAVGGAVPRGVRLEMLCALVLGGVRRRLLGQPVRSPRPPPHPPRRPRHPPRRRPPRRPPQRFGLGREYDLPRRQPGVVDPVARRHVRVAHARAQPVLGLTKAALPADDAAAYMEVEFLKREEQSRAPPKPPPPSTARSRSAASTRRRRRRWRPHRHRRDRSRRRRRRRRRRVGRAADAPRRRSAGRREGRRQVWAARPPAAPTVAGIGDRCASARRRRSSARWPMSRRSVARLAASPR